MQHIKFLRIFIFLLSTVFLMNTVYASGMMSVAQLTSKNKVMEHHPSNDDAHAVHQNLHPKHESQSNQKHTSGDHCSKCTHCMACFSYLSPSELNKIGSQVEETAIHLFKSNYLSPISAQPQRPPIS